MKKKTVTPESHLHLYDIVALKWKNFMDYLLVEFYTKWSLIHIFHLILFIRMSEVIRPCILTD